ncbi:MAG TPA: type II toxin-antitoxin system RelE/ParE family toxin [Caulobacteraceae bacterium]|nr:type II toxin-antitoxin system RelE/ParE family toxin [Caulobacteraceae bacterium]
MKTVVETPEYLASAKDVGMTADERAAAVNMVSLNPTGGDVVVNSGGFRKIRLAGRGKGKSGGYRLLTRAGPNTGYVYLVLALSKGDRADFSAAQLKALRQIASTFR